MEIARIDLWTLAVDSKVHLPQILLHKTLLRLIDKISSFTLGNNTTEHLQSFACQSVHP